MSGGKVIEYIIKAWDKTKEGISSALSNLRLFKRESRQVVEETEENSKRADGVVERICRSAGRNIQIASRIHND